MAGREPADRAEYVVAAVLRALPRRNPLGSRVRAARLTRSTEVKRHMSTKQPVRLALIAALAVLCLGAFAPAALAGRGKPQKPPTTGSGGTISLVLVNSTDGLANWGETVTFNISTTATSEPWVNLKCYQGGVLVAEGYNGYFDRSITGRNFRLYSPSWTGGDADCTAFLTTPQHACSPRRASTSTRRARPSDLSGPRGRPAAAPSSVGAGPDSRSGPMRR